MIGPPLARSAPCRPMGTRLTRYIQSLMASLERPICSERRQYGRVAVPFVLRLTPLGAQGQPLADQEVTAVGKDISPRGLSFLHERPLPYRRAIVILEHPELERLIMEVEIRWCRFSGRGSYESGGHLTRVVNPVPTGPVGRLS